MLYSFSAFGFNGVLIRIEASIRRGLPGTYIVGLPDGAVKESRERVRVALSNKPFYYPKDRILINMAPAGERKYGAGFDLAIAAAILEASKQITKIAEHVLIMGELELSGRVRFTQGILPALIMAQEHGIKNFLIPQENYTEASSIQDIKIFPIRNITDVPKVFEDLAGTKAAPISTQDNKKIKREADTDLDFAQLKAQPLLKRAIELALSGRHNFLMFGPPGSGKSMAMRTINSILPALRQEESVELSRIWSLAGLYSNSDSLIQRAPIRMPHHSTSKEGLVGGGTQLLPGEISLAHNGILFLDETPEFKSKDLQALREPLENHSINIVRVGKSYKFPADIQLVMAANPCPCGNLGRNASVCQCSLAEIQRYWKRIGGALIDRIDLRIPVASAPNIDKLMNSREESSAVVLQRISRARELQYKRFHDCPYKYNSRIPAGHLQKFALLQSSELNILNEASRKLGLSSRACHSIIQVSRTIADLEGKKDIEVLHVLEAIQYRRYGDKDIFWRQLA